MPSPTGPRKPSRKKLIEALRLAEYYYRNNARGDDHHGRVADDILGPLLYDRNRLKRLLDNSRFELVLKSHKSGLTSYEASLLAKIEAAFTDSEA